MFYLIQQNNTQEYLIPSFIPYDLSHHVRTRSGGDRSQVNYPKQRVFWHEDYDWRGIPMILANCIQDDSNDNTQDWLFESLRLSFPCTPIFKRGCLKINT